MIRLYCQLDEKLMKLLYLLLFLSASTYSFASPVLYIKIKDNHVCAFTNVNTKKIYENQVLVYIGKVDGINAFHDSYYKTYSNIKAPIVENNCIIIPSSEFQGNSPYDVVLETDKSYSRRICLKNVNGNLQLLGVNNGYNCSTTQYDYSGNSIIAKLKNFYFWLIGFFN